MAEAGPYGITQFDAAGVLGNVQALQSNRIKMMMEQKQLENLERTSAIQQGTMKALQAYAKGADSPQASSQPATASPQQPVDPLAPLPAAPVPQSASAPSGEMAARQSLLRTMLVLDPEKASNIAEVFSKMDKAQLEGIQARNLHFAQTAAGILQLPMSQRGPAVQQAAQDLGISPQQMQNFQPTDENLRRIVAEGMDVERLAQFSQPKVVPTTQGGALQSISPSGAASTVYESPTIAGPNGEVFTRPSAMTSMPTVQTPQDAAKLPPGTKFRLPDGRVGTVPGGATGNPSPTFPMNNPGALRVPGSMQFQHFSNPQAGISAQEAQLSRYMARGLNNVQSIVETYAPRQSRGGDNSDAAVNNYIGYVSKKLGVNPADTLSPVMLPRLAEAMREFETGQRS